MKLTSFLITLLLLTAPAFAANEPVCPKGLDNAQLLECMINIRDGLQSQLDKDNTAALSDAQSLDKEIPQYKNAEAFLDSKKAFENYMSSECERRLRYSTGASMGGHAEAGCQIELIKERIKALKMGNEK